MFNTRRFGATSLDVMAGSDGAPEPVISRDVGDKDQALPQVVKPGPGSYHKGERFRFLM
jgi:hypothetical protein